MARTFSTMLALGTKAPQFTLPAPLTNTNKSYSECKGDKATLVIFMCNHCPYVVHVIPEIVKIYHDYRLNGLEIIAISSNDIITYPQDGPEQMKEFAYNNSINFPYLYDQTQEIAKAYQAACTPDFFLFDVKDELVYRGQLDDSRPSNGIPVSGTDLRNAIDSVLFNRKINPIQKPSMGCNIKWR